MGWTCCTVPCLLLTSWVVWMGLRTPRAGDGDRTTEQNLRAVWPALAVLFLGLAAWTGWRAQAYLWPQRYVPSIAARATPLVAAIDAYDARHGCPPSQLADLVPWHIASLPTPAWGIDWEFSYRYESSLTQPRWKLIVWTSNWNVEDDSGYYFDSWSRRWGYSDR